MKVRILALSCLIALIGLSEQARADVFTFELDTIPDGVTSFDITTSYLTLMISNPVSGTGFIDADDPGGANRGLTFDFQGSGSDDMSAVDISFTNTEAPSTAVRIIGYNISVSSNGYNDGTYTMSFGSETGLSTALNGHTLATPVDVLSGQNMTIAESTGADFGLGAFVISSITVEAVPEPSAFLFLGLSGLALATRRKRS